MCQPTPLWSPTAQPPQATAGLPEKLIQYLSLKQIRLNLTSNLFFAFVSFFSTYGSARQHQLDGDCSSTACGRRRYPTTYYSCPNLVSVAPGGSASEDDSDGNSFYAWLSPADDSAAYGLWPHFKKMMAQMEELWNAGEPHWIRSSSSLCCGPAVLQISSGGETSVAEAVAGPRLTLNRTRFRCLPIGSVMDMTSQFIQTLNIHFILIHPKFLMRIPLATTGLCSSFLKNGKDSRLPAEFEITDFCQPCGSDNCNCLAVEVMRWSDGTYIP
ncbi:unnamed protein product [Cuscuta campestris]|uniref:Beta-galactosidase n=1 Tax=Cuscuta campestris TaxID=132261 RepID=A0A484M3T3_9ASTE|nr:unnamed protein product [Cuscuta campestris]